MQATGQIPHQEWPVFFDEFTSENKGRPIRLERLRENKSEEVEKDMPLFGVNYDPHHGEMISISLGVDRLKYEHPIMHPREVRFEQDPDGRAKEVRVRDENDDEYIVTFHA